MEQDYKRYALIFQALSDETRLKALGLIANGELCACEILDYLQIKQSTLSYHMKLLTDCGLVNFRRDGKRMLYSITPQHMGFISCLWKELFGLNSFPNFEKGDITNAN